MPCKHQVYDQRTHNYRNCKFKNFKDGYCKRHSKIHGAAAAAAQPPCELKVEDIIAKFGNMKIPSDSEEEWQDCTYADGNSIYSRTLVDPGSERFKWIENMCNDNFFENFSKPAKPKIRVHSAEHIQNPGLYYEYYHKRTRFKLDGKDTTERWGFHGYQTTDLTDILLTQGLIGHANTMCWYGRGVYVATRMQFSTDRGFTARRSEYGKNIHYVLMCRYFTGKYTLGKKNALLPPLLSSKSLQRYDSTTDNVRKPLVFCLPSDAMARIAYLLRIEIL
jgi:hypothetical protein